MKKNRNSKILVVDDSSTNVILLDAILNDKGYQIDTALNAKEALQILRKERPDLILLDLLMPHISGVEFLEKIKKNNDTKDIPVIIISAVTNSEYIEKTMRLGAVDYFKKPIDIQNFINKVETVLKQK